MAPIAIEGNALLGQDDYSTLQGNSGFAKLLPIRGPLAQLVEHLTFNQGVTGSRPVRPTIHYKR